MDVVRLETDRLILDAPTESDVPFIFAYCQDALIQDFTTVPQPYRLRDAENFISKIVRPGWSSGKELTWALRRKDEPTILGVVALRDWNAQQAMVGFWLGAPWRGQGYMPEAVAAVCDWMFANPWSVDENPPNTSIVWEALIGNPASEPDPRKVGFRDSGVRQGAVARFGEFAPSHRAELTVSDRPGPAEGGPAEALSR